MNTISNVVEDIDRGIMAHNMVEDCFSYRITYFVNEDGKGTRHQIDTMYDGLRESLENIVKKHLSLTNSIVIASTTVLKHGTCIRLQSRPYTFSLDGYLQQLSGECRVSRNRNVVYGRYAVR